MQLRNDMNIARDSRGEGKASPQWQSLAVDEVLRHLEACGRESAAPADAEERESFFGPGDRLRDMGRSVAAEYLVLSDANHDAVAQLREILAPRLARKILAGQIPLRPRTHQGPVPVPPRPDDLHAVRTSVVEEIERTSLPETCHRIFKIMNGPVANASRVAGEVSADNGLSRLVMGLVNSDFYGLNMPVKQLERAVAVLGYNELSALALTVATRSMLDRVSGAEAVRFWRRGVAMGVFARLIARRAAVPGEYFFAAGMLSGLGGLVARKGAPVQAGRADTLWRVAAMDRSRAERAAMGIPEAEAGGMLLAYWGSPRELADLVALRVDPARAGYTPEVCVMHLADILAACLDAGEPESVRAPGLDPRAWEELGLSETALDMLFSRGAESTERFLATVMGI